MSKFRQTKHSWIHNSLLRITHCILQNLQHACAHTDMHTHTTYILPFHTSLLPVSFLLSLLTLSQHHWEIMTLAVTRGSLWTLLHRGLDPHSYNCLALISRHSFLMMLTPTVPFTKCLHAISSLTQTTQLGKSVFDSFWHSVFIIPKHCLQMFLLLLVDSSLLIILGFHLLFSLGVPSFIFVLVTNLISIMLWD